MTEEMILKLFEVSQNRLITKDKSSQLSHFDIHKFVAVEKTGKCKSST